ncbi:MAG: hypothetical protein LBT74_12455, partial [Acidobacteriota bacterium]|nr:hypothetical protein [Acidobacteriota bacterium]
MPTCVRFWRDWGSQHAFAATTIKKTTKKTAVVEDEEDEDEEFADGNLLVNPSFEDGMNGWTVPDGKWESVPYAVNSDRYKPRDGKFLSWPKKAARENTFIYQDVPLRGYTAGDTVAMSVMVCNYDQPPHDMGRVDLQFLDGSGNVVKSYTQDQRNPNWNLQSFVTPIPEGAATARLVLHAIHYVGTDVDAYYDKASVVATKDKVSLVYVTEQDGRETAKKGDVLQLVADNGASKKPSDYEWSSSYNTAATVDAKGVATFLT